MSDNSDKRIPKKAPFTRSFKLGARGEDVLAVKRALHASGLLKKPMPMMSMSFGIWARKALRKFQVHRANIHKHVGEYNLATHDAMVAAKLFDAYGIFLMQKYKHKAPDPNVRQRIVNTALFAASRAPRHYSQDMNLRMEGFLKRIKPPQMWNYGDCSGFSTWCYWVAGAPDPNGWGYGGYPDNAYYTGSQAQHGRSVSRSQAKPGDLVFYGSGWPWGHVAVYVGGGMIVSHGHESGPFHVSVDYRSDVGQFRSYV